MARRARRRKARWSLFPQASPEALEPRVVMTASPLTAPPLAHHGLGHAVTETAPAVDPYADFWLDPRDALLEGGLGGQIEQTLFDANQLTGQDHVVDTYGFDGAGQTVAVIDSGIAYSHYALGGGLGEGYRVVGGYDFTENDADPYDDGWAGGHGTHVAGIVGADGDGAHSGVATGVDLVGLRVFDDAGNGYFSWVESALDWVIANRNAFDNPITSVNLSLGTSWNSDSIPAWAMLEDEFAALEAAGVFISVSAGNDYADYSAKGVSYPAASDHVVPVMATHNDGSLAYFSQRAEYAIAAPGVFITSTVPDYAANDGDTIDDDWLSMSGTSMAAPYVAGASVLVREAMEFVGQADIDQWDIYNHMMSTADTFYDSVSATYYQRLNLEAAIDALMPVDDYGSSVATAHHLGTLNDSSPSPLSTTSGVISTLDDGDYFTFTAGVTGQVTVSANGVTHGLVAEWDAWGGAWSESHSGECVIDVVAGQSYTFSISTSGGLGYYDLSIDVESSFAAIDWGAIGPQETRSGLAVAGEQWFRVTAGRDGYFTAEALAASGAATVAIYDAQQNLLTASGTRADYEGTAGEELLLRVAGTSSDFDLRMTNAVSAAGATVTVVGTSADDTFEFTAGGSDHSLSINGVAYTFATHTYSAATFNGGDGTDSANLTGTAGNDLAELRVGSATLGNGAYSVEVVSSERVSVTAGGGFDRVLLYDSAGIDALIARSDRVSLSGAGYRNEAHGFDRTIAFATTGSDRAIFYDTLSHDTYFGSQGHAAMYGSGYRNDAFGFGRSVAYASIGADRAILNDSSGADTYLGWSDRAAMYGSGFRNDAFGFDRAFAYSTPGAIDRAIFYDSEGNDVYSARSDRASFTGDGFAHHVDAFSRTFAYSRNGGNDVAALYDSVGNDTYIAWDHRAVMYGVGFRNEAHGFGRTIARAGFGYDRAFFYDTEGSDTLVGRHDRMQLYGDGYFNEARGFNYAHAEATGGGDQAFLYDSDKADSFRAVGSSAELSGAGYRNSTDGFQAVTAFSQDGDTTDVDAVDFALSLIGAWD